MRLTVGVLDKNGDNVVNRVLDLLHSFDFGQVSHFGVITSRRSFFESPLGIVNRQGLEASSVLGCISSRPIGSSGYESLQLDDSALLFEGRVYAPIDKESLTMQVEANPEHCESLLQTLIEQADGDYAFWMLKEGWMAAGRDAIGMQPLYYGESKNVAAYSTNRRALWRLGIDNPVSFPPGTLGFVDKDGFKFKPVKRLSFNEPKQITLGQAAQRLQALLCESIRRRVHGLKEVAVAFSGGLDSSIIAYLASKQGVKVNLLHVSLENEEETEVAIEAAKLLDLPMQIHLYKESDVEAALPSVVWLVEEADPVKVAIGLPLYWVVQKAMEEKYKVLLAGQGADELFGGYQRYVKECLKNGVDKVQRVMFSDITAIHENNLERDLKISGAFDVELRLPFASFTVAEFALGLPLECKIEPKTDTLRKLVLRKVGEDIGLPAVIVDKPKKAVQYSTGINSAVKRIAKREGKTVNGLLANCWRYQRAGFNAL